jgi:purine-binding chemotaxis protein CheW
MNVGFPSPAETKGRSHFAARDKYVVFCLGETRFAVPILQVLRIVRLTPITRVPNAPHFLEGVVAYRGQAVPVIDLHKRLALPVVEYVYAARILVVEVGPQIIGMLVDMVDDILHLAEEVIQPPSEMVADVNGAYLTGVAQQDGQMVVILDPSRVLTVEEIAGVSAWQAEANG